MSIKTICTALFCFNCTKKEDTPVSSFGRFTTQEKKFEVPMPPVKPPRVDKVVNAFRFRYMLLHKMDGYAQPQQTTWTSDLYFDYRQACKAASDIVSNLTTDVNRAKNCDAYEAMVFHKDFSVIACDVVTINAFDVYQVTLKNGVLVEAKEIILCEGENLVFEKPEGEVSYYKTLSPEESGE